MKVKFYDNKGFKDYCPIIPEYSVLEVYISQKEEKDNFSQVQYVLYTPNPKHYFQEKQCLLQARGYVNLRYLEIVTRFIPPNWQVVHTKKGVHLFPACFYVGWFNDYVSGVTEAINLVNQEGPKILAYDSYKTMKGYFAEEFLKFIEKNSTNIYEIKNWAKSYDLEFLQKMYEKEVHQEIIELLKSLQEESNIENYLLKLRETMVEWSEQGSIALPLTGENFAREICRKEYFEIYSKDIIDEIITDPEIIETVRKIGHRIEDYRKKKYRVYEENILKNYLIIVNVYTSEELTEFRKPI